MVVRRSLALLALPFVVLVLGSAQVSGLVTLHDLRDRARPLLIFAPKPDDARLDIQLRNLHQHAAEMGDREIVPLALPYNNPGSTDAQLSVSEAVEQRRRFHVAPADFLVVLLGKDGGAKLRSSKPLSAAKLVDTVDGMPMRQQEMRQRDPSQQ